MLFLNKPTLVLNKTKCLANIQFMVDKAHRLGVVLRPHFKTHQSLEIGSWFRDKGVTRIAVSSVPMASYFTSDGWDDITIALPFVPQQFTQINELAKHKQLTILASTVNGAIEIARLIKIEVNVILEIDTGQERSGFKPKDNAGIESSIRRIVDKGNLTFSGFLTHAGHSYKANSNEIEILNQKAISELVELKNQWIGEFPNISLSYGDTPTSILANRFDGLDELRPGNFVFFDMQQASKGVCSTNSIAVALLCPVVAVYPSDCKIIIWGGAVHLSKDSYSLPNGLVSFGAVCKVNDDLTWDNPIEGLFIESISQEHGLIRAKHAQLIENFKEGDFVAILPAHACLTADAMGDYFVIGQGTVESFRKRVHY